MDQWGKIGKLIWALLLAWFAPPAWCDPPPAEAPPAVQVAEQGAPAGDIHLVPPAPEPVDLPLPINLAAALRLADGRPLVIAAAQASAWVAEAQLQRAKLLWVPELDLAAIYVRHDGYGPDVNRGNNSAPYVVPAPASLYPIDGYPQRLPLNQNLNWFYGGGGLNLQVALTDVIFQPLAARQVLNSRRMDIQAAKNDALLQTTEAYFTVHQFRGTYAAALDVVARGRKLVGELKHLSKDLIPRVEVDRAERLVADLEQETARARERWRVASADLTEVLRLDPRAVIVPVEHDHLQITLVDPAQPLDQLVAIALTCRPEVASQQAMVQAAAVRIRREKLRPLLPTLLITGFQSPGGMDMQFMAFGEGADHDMNLWSFRDDFSPQVVWQLDGFGFGNLARVKEQRGEQSREVAELFRIQDAVAADVNRAQAHVQSAAARVVEAERGLRQALITYNGNYEGLAQTRRFGNVLEQIYRPQEVTVALQRLWLSYVAYFATVADYNRAQFETYHALGYPAQELANFHPPGEDMPVDTERPSYLPPVGEGPPPPSTR